MTRNPVQPERYFVYFADPMCSWCYGFAPIMAELMKRFRGRLGFRLVMGGLRPGETRPLRPKDRDYLRETWARVSDASGQPFDPTFLERDTFVYDTEPACRAVVTARLQSSDLNAFALLEAISSAFYAGNRDVTETAVLVDIAAKAGFDLTDFEAAMNSADIQTATAKDFEFSNDAGVEGFPCLLVGSQPAGYALVTHGYRPLDGLPEAIEGWLATSP
jgi:putative protein-disulfide isomerase